MDQVVDAIYSQLNTMVNNGEISTFKELEAMKRVFVSLHTLSTNACFSNLSTAHKDRSLLETHHQQIPQSSQWIVRHTISLRVRKRATQATTVQPQQSQS